MESSLFDDHVVSCLNLDGVRSLGRLICDKEERKVCPLNWEGRNRGRDLRGKDEEAVVGVLFGKKKLEITRIS